MERFDLNDFQRKIDALIKKKEIIDKQIDALNISKSIFKEGLGTEIKSDKYNGMSIPDVIVSVLSENKGLRSNQIIDIARKGGAKFTDKSFSSVLSKVVSKKIIKAHKKKGGYRYYLVEKGSAKFPPEFELINNERVFHSGTFRNMQLTDACRTILEPTGKAGDKMPKDKIINILKDYNFNFKGVEPKKAVHGTLMSLKKRGEIGADKINRINYYYLIKK